MYKYESMAEIIKAHLDQRIGTTGPVRLSAKEAREFDGMDDYAENTCYPNVARAMEYVSEHYYPGTVVPGTVRGSTTFAIDYNLPNK
ncbi:MAG: hypothetical protein PHE47_09815 [Oscillospiraceae bacterium]|nr:hypothetical protein [Oscillospiraceae bacterium]